MSFDFIRRIGGKPQGLLGKTIIPSTETATQTAKASPNYDFSNRSNQLRPGETIPVAYGRNIIFPDLAAQPYTANISAVPWRHHTLVIGQGEFEIESLRVGNATFASFGADLVHEIVQPGDEVSIFDPSLSTALGGAGAGFDTKLPTDSTAYNGPYDANPTGTTISSISVSLTYPYGLYGELITYRDATSVVEIDLRLIDNNGDPLGSWYLAATDTVTANTLTAFSRTVNIPSLSGRYQIRARCVSWDSLGNKPAFETFGYSIVRWDGWTVTLDAVKAFGNVTILAVRIKASSVSDDNAQKINVTATRKIRTWSTAGGFSEPIASLSPIWALVDLLTNATYGGKLSTSRIDLSAMESVADELDARGDEFNGIFDKKQTLWEAAKLICQVARCTPVLRRGVVTVIRDRLEETPVLMLSGRNIISGSFSISYDIPQDDEPDGVKVEYLSSLNWLPSEISTTATGTAPANPRTIKLFGVTNAGQAYREALYHARQTYRRTTIQLRTELEGQILTFGDLVAVSHDLPEWGVSGDVVSVATNGDLILSDPSTLEQAETLYAAFRTSTGAVSGPWEIEPGDAPDSVRLVGTWAVDIDGSTATLTSGANEITIYTGAAAERTHYISGVGVSFYRLCRVKSVKTNGLLTNLVLMVEDARVHED